MFFLLGPQPKVCFEFWAPGAIEFNTPVLAYN